MHVARLMRQPPAVPDRLLVIAVIALFAVLLLIGYLSPQEPLR